MADGSERTLFLLGAGASVEAGLPTSVVLTTKIAQAIERRRRDAATTLNIVMGAMYAHSTSRGGRVSEGLDVESVFAAVEQLAKREELEIAPFVASWVSGIGTVGGNRLPAGWGRRFTQLLEGDGAFRNADVEDIFAIAVRQIAGTSDIRPAMVELRREMLRALEQVLTVDPGSVDYLAPLLAGATLNSPVRIVTLNYDSTIEEVARRADLIADTGLGRWSGGYEWSFAPDAVVHLLKVHGSLGWNMGLDYSANDGRLPAERLIQGLPERGERTIDVQPALVFGQGTKLRSDGPFLAMLVELDRMLRETDHLVVVGYSFRDPHINTQLERWLARQLGRRVTVIDPMADEWVNGIPVGPDFVTNLRRAKPPAPDTDYSWPHHFVAGTTEGELRTLLGPGPALHA